MHQAPGRLVMGLRSGAAHTSGSAEEVRRLPGENHSRAAK